MDAKKREIRNLECQLAFREATGEESAQGILGTITGRAIVFNAESQVLDEYGQTFREVIAPEAATMDFLNTQDIKINMLHMRELTFGRAKRGVGNARLSVDNEGVNFEVAVPNCDLGIRARELTKAGVYDGCSFEFWPDKYDIEEREGKVPLVRHTHFRAITALTLGMDPAYLQTSLSARELLDTIEHREDEEEKQNTDDEKKVEEEEKAAEEAEEKEESAETKEAEETDDEREARELAEQEQREREAVAVMRMRRNRLSLMNREIEDIIY
jgi:HK97 family phage prohead protease